MLTLAGAILLSVLRTIAPWSQAYTRGARVERDNETVVFWILLLHGSSCSATGAAERTQTRHSLNVEKKRVFLPNFVRIRQTVRIILSQHPSLPP